jgi:hypothetical protein
VLAIEDTLNRAYLLGGESNGGHSHNSGDEVELHFGCRVVVVLLEEAIGSVGKIDLSG